VCCFATLLKRSVYSANQNGKAHPEVFSGYRPALSIGVNALFLQNLVLQAVVMMIVDINVIVVR
jgi:hypothetical protein